MKTAENSQVIYNRTVIFYEIMVTEIKSSFNTTGHFLCEGDESLKKGEVEYEP